MHNQIYAFLNWENAIRKPFVNAFAIKKYNFYIFAKFSFKQSQVTYEQMLCKLPNYFLFIFCNINLILNLT